MAPPVPKPAAKVLKPFTGLFYGWRMIAAASAVRVLGTGLHSYGFTVFFLPLSQELNLSRTATSFAFSLSRAEGAIEGPIVGHLLDRYGPRPIMLAIVVLMGAGYLLLFQVNSYIGFLIVYTGLISLTHSGGFMHAPMVLTNTWFIRLRARAMTINSAEYGLGGVLLAPLLSMIVHSWGWRGRCRDNLSADWNSSLPDDSPVAREHGIDTRWRATRG